MNTNRLKEFIDGPDEGEGRSLGKYRIVREIGRGGMAIVYEAEDPELKRRVALKVLRDGDWGPEIVKRLHREATIAAQLQHPNIVGVHEVGVVDDTHFIAMEYVEGATLWDLMRGAKTARPRLVGILEDAARAVGFAHAKGVIHRDVKPSNIMIASDGRVVLMDFGLARAESLASRLTRSQAVLGTPQYMAPEQVEGRQHEIDERTDVYALGVVLYEILAGDSPFRAETAAALYQKILHDEPTPPSRLAPLVEADLEVVCLKAMDKERHRRYATATEFADELARCRRGEPIQARPASLIYKLRKRLAKRKALVAVVAAVTLAALAPLAMREWSFRQSREEAIQALASREWPRALAAAEQAMKIRTDDTLLEIVATCRERIAEEQRRAEADRRYRLLKDRIQPLEDAIKDARPYFYIEGDVLLEKLKKIERAIGDLQAIADEPENAKFAEVWTAIGMGWYFAGDSRRAEDALVKAADLAPDNGWVNYYLGRIYHERSMWATLGGGRAETTEMKRAKSRPWSEKALLHMRRSVKEWAGAEEIDRHVAETYVALSEGKDDEVLRRCEEGLRKFGDAIGTEEYWVLRGWVRPEERVETLTKAIKRRPHYAWAYFGRGRAWHLKGDLEKAIADYDAAIRVNPRMAEAMVNRATARFDRREVKAAIADLDEAIKLNPTLPEAWSNRGSMRLLRGDKDGALRDFDEALKLNPSLAEVYVNRANVKVNSKDPDGAIADCREAIRIYARLPEAYAVRGMAYQSKGMIQEAIADFERALDLAPPEWTHRSTIEGLLKRLKG